MSIRIDKFIWCVRLSKTRSKATERVKKGKVKLNGAEVKPSKDVQINDVVQITNHNAVFSYKVKDVLNKRVGAKLVEDYIIDITPPEEVEKFKTYLAAQRTYRHHGSGKPTKKDRRAISSFMEWDEEEDWD
jgi:ribosome-associated heat shock protein Hsp15